MEYRIVPVKKEGYHISRHLHSTFFEYYGRTVYDGIWVGKNSPVPNADGIRLDVIEGCREAGIAAMRWPGGCCADHYHWKEGVGPERWPRLHFEPCASNDVWPNDFGTDEFLRLCELTGADPVITVNTATGTPEEFLDWYEYVNGPVTTRWGHMRAVNGHPAPYGVKYWGIGNTDENVWLIDHNNPVAYAQTYLKFQAVLRDEYRKKLCFIGLGLSTRHNQPGWVGRSLDHITRNQRDIPPDALSIHHYLGGSAYGMRCGDAVDYTDEEYAALLDGIERYQYDIDLHRMIIREHAGPGAPTKISFDEWGIVHPEATLENDLHERQTLRDGLFAALALHTFYRNADIVEFAMETQLSNLLQSLFETDGPRFFKTPTFYVMKLFREHADQELIHTLPDDVAPDLDTVSTLSADGTKMTVSIVNRALYDAHEIRLRVRDGVWRVSKADIVTCDDVRAQNTFDDPERIRDRRFDVPDSLSFTAPPHSVIRLCLRQAAVQRAPGRGL